MTNEVYLDPSDANVIALFSRNISGEVAMLNLLRFRDVADYSAFPELAPAQPISGREAYDRYIKHTMPFLTTSGGKLLYLGEGGNYLIGPENRGWDLAMLVSQHSVQAFMEFASNEAYIAGIGHRTAAVADSRILPLTAPQVPDVS